MNTGINQYVKFLTDTLGIKSILTAPEKPNSIKFVICVESLDSYQKTELDLLNKMIAALKLKSENFLILDSIAFKKQMHDFSNSKIIKLKDKPVNSDETFSARALLIQPDLKRTAWIDLQRLVKN